MSDNGAGCGKSKTGQSKETESQSKDKKEENSGNPYMEEGKGRVLRDILWKEEKNT